jgi:hypothetical protein
MSTLSSLNKVFITLCTKDLLTDPLKELLAPYLKRYIDVLQSSNELEEQFEEDIKELQSFLI